MVSRNIMLSIIAIVLLAGCFSGGMIAGWAVPLNGGANPIVDLPFLQDISSQESAGGVNDNLSDNPDELLDPFWQTWDLVHDQYVDQPVDDELMMQGAIRGMVESLGDPHTSYMDPDQYQQMNVRQEGEYEGIGAWVDITGDYLTIISPMPGSPAETADLKPEDKVIAVDGDDMTGIDGNLVLRRILGPAGTKVVLTISREGVPEPFDVELERAKITIPSVTGEMLEGNIAYVQLYTFGDNTVPELRSTLKDLLDQDPDGLILDLRNNGGGYLHTAIEVVSQFIPSGKVVMYEEFGDGTRHTFKAKHGGIATEIPLVVLINEGTASASEITAGAIQDYDRGKLVGVTTFGKGSVQSVVDLDDDQGAVRVTIARWLTPNERLIHETGLEPDVEVELTIEDIEAEHDSQLEKAIEQFSNGE